MVLRVQWVPWFTPREASLSQLLIRLKGQQPIVPHCFGYVGWQPAAASVKQAKSSIHRPEGKEDCCVPVVILALQLYDPVRLLHLVLKPFLGGKASTAAMNGLMQGCLCLWELNCGMLLLTWRIGQAWDASLPQASHSCVVVDPFCQPASGMSEGPSQFTVSRVIFKSSGFSLLRGAVFV